jgi:hypothetical protein
MAEIACRGTSCNMASVAKLCRDLYAEKDRDFHKPDMRDDTKPYHCDNAERIYNKTDIICNGITA